MSTKKTVKSIKKIVLITGVLFLSCVIPSEPPQEVIKMSFCSPDTISPYSSVKIGFSMMVEDSQVAVRFSPPFFDYHHYLISSGDTLHLIPSLPLKGSTSYKLFFSVSTVSSSPQPPVLLMDSFSFHTFAHEREPNNTKETADLLSGKIFGSISNINDTDFFLVTDIRTSAFYLNTTYSESVFSILDSTGKIADVMEYRSSDTLTVPDSFKYPLCLRVYSYNRSSGGYYEAGLIRKSQIPSQKSEASMKSEIGNSK